MLVGHAMAPDGSGGGDSCSTDVIAQKAFPTKRMCEEVLTDPVPGCPDLADVPGSPLLRGAPSLPKLHESFVKNRRFKKSVIRISLSSPCSGHNIYFSSKEDERKLPET